MTTALPARWVDAREMLNHAAGERRQARAATELADLDTHRAVARAHAEGMPQREISPFLNVSQPEVHRILKRTEVRPELLNRSPREVALLYAASRITRAEMIQELSAWQYTPGHFADADEPEPENYIPGTADQLADAVDQELISEQDYEFIYEALQGREPAERATEVETVSFGIDGVGYEIDLTAQGARALREALSKFVEAGRRTSGTSRPAPMGTSSPRGTPAHAVDQPALSAKGQRQLVEARG